jgi:putative resolvase
MTDHTEGLPLGQAAKYLGVHPKTLQRWEREGKLPCGRTVTGRRTFTRDELDRFMGCAVKTGAERAVAYLRSPNEQRSAELFRAQRRAIEQYILPAGIANVEYLEEIGSSLDSSRKVFDGLLRDLLRGDLREIIVGHQYLLLFFGYPLFESICRIKGTKLTSLCQEELLPEKEMIRDLKTITAGFAARI